VTAEPVVEASLAGKPGLTLLYVAVGQRDFWKDKNCVFRTDPSTELKSVPTLVAWGGRARLEEEKCADKAMVDMLVDEVLGE